MWQKELRFPKKELVEIKKSRKTVVSNHLLLSLQAERTSLA